MAESTYDTTSSPSYPNSGTTTPPTDSNPEPVTHDGTISVISDTQSVYSGETAVMQVNIDSDGAKVKQISVTIEFDSDMLQAEDSESLTAGSQIDVTSTNFTVQNNEIDNDTGEITLNLTSDTAVVVDENVAQVTFKAIDTGSASVTVSQTASSLSDEDSNDILYSTQGETLSITAQNTVPVSPPVEPEPEPALPQSGITGASGVTLIGAIVLIAVSFVTFLKRKKDAS